MQLTPSGYRAGTVFGFPIFIAESALITVPVLLGFVILNNTSTGDMLRAAVQIAIIIVAVIVHELAHALTARAVGVPVRSIVLTWFGGYAAFWVAPTRWREAVIAFAGPASNLAIGLMLLGVIELLPPWSNVEIRGADLYVSRDGPPFVNYALQLAATVNISLGIFNLVPGLPLDGGHILRALLSLRISERRAHWIAAWSGVVTGALVIGYAFWVESFWALGIGALIITAAWHERRTA